ncbi:MAG: energy-coupling factor ABC transporter permease [Magnetospiraceae bacterium]
MHIEPGYVAPVKVALANAGALTVFAWAAGQQFRAILKAPWMLLKTVAAALFFTLFMEIYFMPVGPSELHFVGAMAMYLTLGFLPTVAGFAIGLLFQGLVFNPQDLVHLGVNSLSLMLPLIAVHYAAGKRVLDGGTRVNWAQIVKLDAMYYTGVTAMVGFWLMIGDVATPLSAWFAFASSYLAIVALEPLVTIGAVKGLRALGGNPLVANLFVVNRLRMAA